MSACNLSEIWYYVAAALLSLGFFLQHTASMVVFFDGLANNEAVQTAVPPLLHIVASFLVGALLCILAILYLAP